MGARPRRQLAGGARVARAAEQATGVQQIKINYTRLGRGLALQALLQHFKSGSEAQRGAAPGAGRLGSAALRKKRLFCVSHYPLTGGRLVGCRPGPVVEGVVTAARGGGRGDL